MQHRKLIKIVEIQDNELVKVYLPSQMGEAFKTKSKPVQIIESKQSDFAEYVNEKLDLLKSYLSVPYKQFIIMYGGHDEQNDKCSLVIQYQQNLNKNKLPQINQSTQYNQFNQKRSKDLLYFNQTEKKCIDRYKNIDGESQKFNRNLQQYKPNKQIWKTAETQCRTKLGCICKQQDQIFEQNNYGVEVMRLSEFKIYYREGNEMILKNTIHYEQDILNGLELLKNSENNQRFQEHTKYPFIKLNQCIGIKEQQLLSNTGQFWTSSMIDGYANYLNGRDEKSYFQLPKEQREIYKRLYIFTSDFITNCNLNSQSLKEKWLLLMLEKLEIFKTIQYQFWLIYQKIAFIVNRNNSHWYMVTLDLNERFILVYDSLKSSHSHYRMVGELLSYLFYQLQKNKLIQDNIQQDQYQFKIYAKPNFLNQNDSYSCGYYTCIALENYSKQQISETYKNKNEIKDILKKILLSDPQK